MHEAVKQWLDRVVRRHDLTQMRVLELGSYDVNGSVRPYFQHCKEFVGVDLSEGPGVDVVCNVHDLQYKEEFHIVVSTGSLEHDSNPRDWIDKAWAALKPGGWLILSCAGTGWEPHSARGGPLRPGEYYNNVDPADLARWTENWDAIIEYTNEHDLFLLARKPD